MAQLLTQQNSEEDQRKCARLLHTIFVLFVKRYLNDDLIKCNHCANAFCFFTLYIERNIFVWKKSTNNEVKRFSNEKK